MIDLKMKKPGKLTVQGELTLPHAVEFKEALTDLFKNHKSASIHFGEVTEVDLSCLQLLCSIHRTFIESKKKLAFESSLPELLERTVEDAGYSRQRGCPKDSDNCCFWVKGEDK